MRQKKSSSKSRLQPTNGTILDFFAAKQSSSTSNSAQPTRQNKGKSRDSDSQAVASSSVLKKREIIVIDADSDDEPCIAQVKTPSAGASTSKRLKLSPHAAATSSSVKLEDASNHDVGWSDIELEEGGSKSRLSCFGDPFLLQDSDPVANSRNEKTESGSTAELATPSRCFNNTSSPSGHSGALQENGVDGEPPNIGKPLLPKDSDCTSLNPPPTRPQPQPIQRDCSRPTPSSSECKPSSLSFSKNDMDVDIDLTLDFWETGDDEWADNDTLQTLDVDDTDESIPLPLDHPILECKPSNSIFTTNDPSSSTSNAFSRLMASHKEAQIWQEADVVSDCSFHPTKSNRRKAPFYKVLEGMPIAVDAFKYGAIPGVTAYFLTYTAALPLIR